MSLITEPLHWPSVKPILRVAKNLLGLIGPRLDRYLYVRQAVASRLIEARPVSARGAIEVPASNNRPLQDVRDDGRGNEIVATKVQRLVEVDGWRSG